MIRFAVGQTEEPLLEDRVFAVPQGQREAEMLLAVGEAGQAVFAPSICARPRLIVGEEVPGVAVFAVILAHGPPLPFAQIRSPLLPLNLLFSRFIKALLFGDHVATCSGLAG
jgi:hypothetical protein